MTSEVCLMNRHALVLAADSATTVSRWVGSERETRYFKGANKIHQLSDHHPVGLMIFSSADILNVPWEVVIKAFRKSIGDKSFNTIEGYAEEFFGFLETEIKFFPPEPQKDAAVSAARLAAYRIAMSVHDAATGPAAWTAALDAKIPEERAVIDAVPLGDGLDDVWAQTAIETLVPDVAKAIDAYLNLHDREPRPSDFGPLAELALWTILKRPDDCLNDTGLVFAGFGDHDVFPCHVHYTSYGLLAGKPLFAKVSREEISHTLSADLTAFAQKSMIQTFQLGLDASVYADAMVTLDEVLDKFGADIAADLGVVVPDITAKKAEARNEFRDNWLQKTRTAHSYPLRRVLSSLPINEMAELAETLVNLQSLKEKVTKPSEEVGGPVDVAVITKNEGLIWIRRKHYFDPALNVRYMARVRGLYE